MRKRRRFMIYASDSMSSDTQALLASWMCRMLLARKWTFRGFYHKRKGYQDQDVADFLCMPELEEAAEKTETAIRSMLRLKLAEFEKIASTHTALHHNVKLLGNKIGLSPLQEQMLVFAILTKDSSVWQDLFRVITVDSEVKFMDLMTTMFEVTLPQIRKALARDSLLRRAGLLSLDKSDYEDGLLTITNELRDALSSENDSEEEILSHFLQPTKGSTLTLDDYPHAVPDLEILQALIKGSAAGKKPGVNMLIYGRPGTGKTELVRMLAAQLNMELYEIKNQGKEGDALSPEDRLRNYRLSQHMMAGNHKGLILFDEVEDIFPSRSYSIFGMEVKSGETKGWMNSLLEENPCPSLWVSNQIQQIDPAFLRRFDYVMELSAPPKTIRLKIARSYLKNQAVSSGFIERLASHDGLPPAMMAQLARVASNLPDDIGNLESTLEKVLNNSLLALGGKALAGPVREATKFDLGYLNASMDLSTLVTGLTRTGRGNLCFYGPPGTGKTALAGHIAAALDRPLMSCKTSDILDRYVGGTEENIARMFAQATRDNTVLVLDEADSLLRDRRGAQRSWEVTQVNELLVQMEQFEGLFICTTNLMEDLDQASLRRFALKVHFGWLMPDQAEAMLKAESRGRVTAAHKRRIRELTCLAPGDFAAAKKRMAILGMEPDPGTLLRELAQEVQVKAVDHSNRIGF